MTNKTHKGQGKYIFLLFLTAFLWGFGFVGQSVGVDRINPITFNCVRNLAAAIFIGMVAFIFDRTDMSEEAVIERQNRKKKENKKELIIAGIVTGAVLTFASTMQTVGIVYASAGKTGFVTALYIVLVPVFGIFLGHKHNIVVWISVVLATVGLFLLCVTEKLTFAWTDIYLLLGAIGFTLHILVIDHYSSKVNGVWMSAIQFLSSGLILTILTFIVDDPDFHQILSCWAPILYVGVVSGGMGYTMQIVAQKHVNPALASLIMSLESVVSALAGWIFLHEVMTFREISGCAIMFAAIVLVQIDFDSILKKKNVG